jgi:mevalonate pyrophosphate decarboxylase
MNDLIVFFYETFDVTIEKMIEKLRACSFEKRYQAQTIILDRIVQNNIVLKKNNSFLTICFER